jgi:hypothetical protein
MSRTSRTKTTFLTHGCTLSITASFLNLADTLSLRQASKTCRRAVDHPAAWTVAKKVTVRVSPQRPLDRHLVSLLKAGICPKTLTIHDLASSDHLKDLTPRSVQFLTLFGCGDDIRDRSLRRPFYVACLARLTRLSVIMSYGIKNESALVDVKFKTKSNGIWTHEVLGPGEMRYWIS